MFYCLPLKRLVTSKKKNPPTNDDTSNISVNEPSPLERNDKRNLTVQEKEQWRYSMLLTGYNAALEFTHENLEIDFDEVVAQGTFAVYYKGKAKGINSGLNVLIKTLRPEAELMYFKALVRELKLLSSMQEHENILSLMGACTANVHLREIILVLEYGENGTLDKYLQSHHNRFVDKFAVDTEKTSSNVIENIYENVTRKSGAISTLNLLKWAQDICTGMDFLASNRFIHWELSPKSIYLTNLLTAKIGDFHNTRRLPFSTDVLILKEEISLPWRRISPESIIQFKFYVQKSDVYTFSSCLWEMFNLSKEEPWHDYEYAEFIDSLSSGLRPPAPMYSSAELYKLMEACWSENVTMRPSFHEISSFLLQQINNLTVIPYSDV